MVVMSFFLRRTKVINFIEIANEWKKPFQFFFAGSPLPLLCRVYFSRMMMFIGVPEKFHFSRI